MNDTEQRSDDIVEINPWTDLWTRPRQTIAWIIDNKYSGLFTTLLLIYLAGVSYGFGNAMLKDHGDKKELAEIISSALLTSGLGGLITYNILIWAIDFCATWFGGRGNFSKTQIAFAWSMVPSSIGALTLYIIGYVLFEDELFKSEQLQTNIYSSSFLYGAYWFFAIAEVALGLLAFSLLTRTISEIQQLTILKSIVSIVVGAVLCILPAIGIIYLIKAS